jgi:hypothetical protein
MYLAWWKYGGRGTGHEAGGGHLPAPYLKNCIFCTEHKVLLLLLEIGASMDAGCMAALQAEHFLQEHGSSFAEDTTDGPTANGDAATLQGRNVAAEQPVAAL